jgi:hypothetical protein
MFSSKKSYKKFWQKLHAPRKLRSSAPSVLFQLGPKEQPLSSAAHTASPVDSDAASSSESSDSLPHSPPPETASETSDSDAPPLTPPSIDTDPPPSPEPVEPVIVVIPHILPDSDDDMADSLALGPTLFTGAHGQDPKIWLASLGNYSDYKELTDEKKLALFKLRLGDTARDWLIALPDAHKDTFAHLSAAFIARFQPQEIEKYKFARDLFNQKQQTGQSVDAYITDLKTKAAIVGLDAKSLLYVAISGLRSDLVTYVVQRSPATLDELLTHARVAELSRAHEVTQSDDKVTKQLEQLSEQMSVLTAKMCAMTTATVDNQRSLTPDRRVTFRENRSRSTSPSYSRQEPQNNVFRTPSKSPERSRTTEFRQFDRPANRRYTQQWQQQGNAQPYSNSRFNGRQYIQAGQQPPAQFCSRCGRVNGHPNPLYCPMTNKECFTCGKRGHSFKLCRSNGYQTRQNY